MKMQRHGSSDSHESSHGIDLAPMLDFVLNLLIFFIITAIFVKSTAVEVNRPTGFEQPNDSDSKSIQIQVLATGEIFMDNREVDVRAVRANVERESAINPDAGVLVLADSESPTGTLVSIVEQVQLGGIYNITFTSTE